MLAMLEFAMAVLELAVVAVTMLELAVTAVALAVTAVALAVTVAIASNDPMSTLSAMPMRELVCSIRSCSGGGASS